MTPLPLADTAAADPDALRGDIQVFDPAMCCPTGVCGPGVDPVLLALARDLRWLTAKGVTVQRHGLAQEPQAFAANSHITGLLQAFGEAALPATLVNGRILVHGRYPVREELVAALLGAAAPNPAGDSGCCAPGSGCC